VEEKERFGGLDARGADCSGNGWGTSRAGGELGMRGNAEVEALGEGVGGDVGAGVGVGVTDLDGSGGTSKGLVFVNDDGNIAWQWEMKGRGGRG
jgi:hypothetical protein